MLGPAGAAYRPAPCTDLPAAPPRPGSRAASGAAHCRACSRCRSSWAPRPPPARRCGTVRAASVRPVPAADSGSRRVCSRNRSRPSLASRVAAALATEQLAQCRVIIRAQQRHQFLRCDRRRGFLLWPRPRHGIENLRQRLVRGGIDAVLLRAALDPDRRIERAQEALHVDDGLLVLLRPLRIDRLIAGIAAIGHDALVAEHDLVPRHRAGIRPRRRRAARRGAAEDAAITPLAGVQVDAARFQPARVGRPGRVAKRLVAGHRYPCPRVPRVPVGGPVVGHQNSDVEEPAPPLPPIELPRLLSALSCCCCWLDARLPMLPATLPAPLAAPVAPERICPAVPSAPTPPCSNPSAVFNASRPADSS